MFKMYNFARFDLKIPVFYPKSGKMLFFQLFWMEWDRAI